MANAKILHWGPNATFLPLTRRFRVGGNANFSYLDTNMLVSPMQICGIWDLKPIFHCKLGSRWETTANEIDTNNMKCTWPTRTF